jgi:hypothetical protein
MTRSLFLLKRRHDYTDNPDYFASPQIATGMYNSAKFVVDELTNAGREAKLELCVDANSIDKIVTDYKPTHVFIEGLWVTPAKFQELMKIGRHKNIQWFSRIHSEIPFIATEGSAFEWIPQYLKIGVKVAPNAPRAHEQVKWLAKTIFAQTMDKSAAQSMADTMVPYLPNCYPVNFQDFPLKNLNSNKEHIDIACFGAFRPMKNHLQQAFIAMKYAEMQNKKLRFHVNSRKDQGGDGPAKNTKNLLEAAGCEFVAHGWEDRETFLSTLGEMDLLMQLSMSETFNIVAADATLVGRPIIVSKEINWAYPAYADPNSVGDSLQKLDLIMSNKPFFINSNRAGLNIYASAARRRWLNFIGV